MTTECVLDSCMPADGVAALGADAVGHAPELPCQVTDADLWFAEDPRDLERAKALCVDCPLREVCLQAALERAEPWGVWGGEIFDRGTVVARKRPRGRPRKNAA
ncbi:WhiB family transcriptional regulator [Gordonia sp. VNQ95]|jgi:WhiB family redox-sensing transcriptional regulator|uniref:WhiB family transcriptional regulator n=1 Tax=Gordonia TaxID=2053 RepID=UPI0032B44514